MERFAGPNTKFSACEEKKIRSTLIIEDFPTKVLGDHFTFRLQTLSVEFSRKCY